MPADPRSPLDLEVVVPSASAISGVISSRLYGTRISSLEVRLDPRRPFPKQVHEIAQRVRGGEAYVPVPSPNHPEWSATLAVAAEKLIGVKFRTSGPFRSDVLSDDALARWIRDAVAAGVPFKCGNGSCRAVRQGDDGARIQTPGLLNVMAATLGAIAGERVETLRWWLAARNGATLAGGRPEFAAIHAVLAEHGLSRTGACFTAAGRAWLEGLDLPDASRTIIDQLLFLLDALNEPIAALDRQLAAQARGDPRVAGLTQLPGVGVLTALVIVTEVGDVNRFPSARKLAAWAGLTPHRAQFGPDRATRTHLQAGLGMAAVDSVRGCPDRKAITGVRRHLSGHRAPSRQENRHHGDRPQADHPRLSRPTGSRLPPPQEAAMTTPPTAVAGPPGALANPHEPAQLRSMT